MRRLMIPLLLLTLVVTPLSAFTPWCFRPPYRFTAGYRVQGINNRDFVNKQDFPSTRNSYMFGPEANISYVKPWCPYAGINTWYGETNLHENKGTNWRFRHFETMGRLGLTFAFGCRRSFLIIPYFGFGYRRFTDIQSIDKYIYTTYNVPVGVYINFLRGDCLEVDLHIEFTPAIRSLLRYDTLSDTKISINQGVRFPTENRDGWLIEIPVIYKYPLSRWMQIDVGITPFFQAMWFGLADAAQITVACNSLNFGLPRRDVYLFGVRFEIGARF